LVVGRLGDGYDVNKLTKKNYLYRNAQWFGAA